MLLIANPKHSIDNLRNTLKSAEIAQKYKPTAINARLINALKEAIRIKTNETR